MSSIVIKGKEDLYIDGRKITPQELGRYDIVLTTHSFLQTERIGHEFYSQSQDLHTNGKKKNEIESMEVSVLMQVHWFRVIVDEGIFFLFDNV